MKVIAPPTCALFFLLGYLPAAFANNPIEDGDLLKKYCGYGLDEALKSKVVRRSSKIAMGSYWEESDITISVNDTAAYGRLSFSCPTSANRLTESLSLYERTASEEIEREDAGGRYARIISWASDFHGHGWRGTIAHTNAIFGDGTSFPTSDFFLVCPNTIASSCFSFEIQANNKLAEGDRKAILSLLSAVSYHF